MAEAPDALRIELDGSEVEHLVAAGAVPGVAVLHTAGCNGTGCGRLRTNTAGTALQWKAPGSATWGPEVAVPSDGEYLLHDGSSPSKWLRVQVWTAHLAGSIDSEVAIRNVFNNAIGHDDISAAEAAAGDAATWTLTLRNASDEAISMLRCWIDAACSGLEISADGSSWSSPSTESAALALSDLAAAATTTLYVRRTIAAGAAADADVLNHLHFRYEL